MNTLGSKLEVMHRYIFGILMVLFFSLLICSCEDENYGHSKPYYPISEERSKFHETFKNIICDVDKLSPQNTSLDSFRIESILCKNQDKLESCDSAYFNQYNLKFWIKTGETLFLKNKRIIFNSDSIANQLELSHKNTGDYPFLEFYSTYYEDVASCCVNLHVNKIDTLPYKINFSLPAFGDESRFEIVAIH